MQWYTEGEIQGQDREGCQIGEEQEEYRIEGVGVGVREGVAGRVQVQNLRAGRSACVQRQRGKEWGASKRKLSSPSGREDT